MCVPEVEGAGFNSRLSPKTQCDIFSRREREMSDNTFSKLTLRQHAHDLRNTTLAVRMIFEVLEIDDMHRQRLGKAVAELDRLSDTMELEAH